MRRVTDAILASHNWLACPQILLNLLDAIVRSSCSSAQLDKMAPLIVETSVLGFRLNPSSIGTELHHSGTGFPFARAICSRHLRCVGVRDINVCLELSAFSLYISVS